MLRIFLPPNLAAAAGRDAIAIKVEIDPKGAPPASLLPGLALLSQWSGGQAPEPKAGMPLRLFYQLSRAQLRDLLNALKAQPIFVWTAKPDLSIPWSGSALAGVSEHLVEATKPVEALAPRTASPPPRATSSLPGATLDGSEHFLAVTLPPREHFSYGELLDLIKSTGFLPEPSNGKWWLRDRHKVLTFLATHGGELRGKFGIRTTPNFDKNTANIRPAEILCLAEETGKDFAITLGLKAGNATEADIRSAIVSGRGYVEAAGQVILLDPRQMESLARAQRALSGDGGGASPRKSQKVSGARAAEVDALLESLSPDYQAPSTWKERSSSLRNLSSLQPAPLPADLDSLLRPYQRLGTAWLWHLYRHGLGGILADEMGLGKTVQAIALLLAVQLQKKGGHQSHLVVCPASLLENWRREVKRFAPHLRVFVHHGANRLGEGAEAAGHDLIITSYGTLVRDEAVFSGRSFACVIADEAQHIKNRQSQNARALRTLRADSRFLLTGTPLENSLDDLRSLFEFLLPGYLDRVPPGARGEDREWINGRLRAQTAPYILRRTKSSVAPELPPKVEQIVWCEFSAEQSALYRSIQEKSEREILDMAAGGAGEGRLRLAVLTQLLRLRQVCCDPRLVGQTANSAKLEAFRELLEEAVDDGHRILVFSQFTSLLALVREELDTQGIAHCYLDGSMPTKARQAEVDRFQNSPEIPAFLLSLKAGGTGLNLTGADTVIHLDPWWNPAAELQATDRAHRIGQTRMVTSYKLIASGTVEEKVLALQAEKRALLADVFEASDEASARLSLADLKALLA